MRIIFNIKELNDVLEISKSDLVFINTNAEAIANCGDMQVIKKLNASVEEKGSTLISKNIINMLPKVGECIVTENSIECEKRSIKFKTTDIEIKELKVDEPVLTVISQETLNFLLEVDYAVSKNEARPILQGVYFGNDITCALDGDRLSIRRTSDMDINTEFVVPLEIIKAIKKVKDIDNVSISVSKDYIKFQCGNTTVIGKLIGGKYIHFESLIQSEFKTIVKLDCKQVLDIIKSYKNVEVIKFNIESEKFSITADIIDNKLYKNNVIGTIKDEVPCELTGENLEIFFDPRYLKDALKNKENAKFYFNNSHSPLLIKEIVKKGEKIELILPIHMG